MVSPKELNWVGSNLWIQLPICRKYRGTPWTPPRVSISRIQAVGNCGSKGRILQQINCKEQKGMEAETLSIKRDSKERWDFERWQDYSARVGRHLGDKTVKKDKRPDSYQSTERGHFYRADGSWDWKQGHGGHLWTLRWSSISWSGWWLLE